MAASAKSLKLEHTNTFGDWTIVTPRRGKQKRRIHLKAETVEQPPWTPTDSEIDPEGEMKLMQKMQTCMKKLENSEFYWTCLDKMQAPQVLDHFSRILASESKMQMLIYGIGSIESYETPRLQLSLAILIKQRFDWIGDIEVFDPVLSKTETRVLEALGCSVLLVNEHGRRQALKPTMFFMPHCEAVLYDNLLQANWGAEFLNKMVLFGNSFETYEQYISVSQDSNIKDALKFVLGVRRFLVEVGIDTVSDDFFRAFHDSSWHFFNLDSQMEAELRSLKL